MKAQVIEKIAALTTAAFGLVAALAWNDAIKKLFEVIFGKSSNVAIMFLYAIIITVVVVLVTMKLSKATGKLKEELDKGKKKKK